MEVKQIITPQERFKEYKDELKGGSKEKEFDVDYMREFLPYQIKIIEKVQFTEGTNINCYSYECIYV